MRPPTSSSTLLALTVALTVGCGTTEAPPARRGLSAGMSHAVATQPAVLDPAGRAARTRVDSLTPWLDTPALQSAVEDFQAGRNHPAARALEAAAAAEPGSERGRAAAFLALLARHDGGVYDPTAERLEALALSWPLMADYALFYAGSAHLHAGRGEAAVAALRAVPEGSTLAHRAIELEARALALTDRGAAVARLREALEASPEARPALWRRLTELLDAGGDADGVRVALRELASRFPTRDDGRWALERLGDAPGFDGAQWLRVAEGWFRSHRHPAAIHALERALEAFEEGTAEHCQARGLLARTYDKTKQGDTAWRHYREALDCEGDVLADATFAGGRNRLRAGAWRDARRLLRRHVDTFAGRSTQDDAQVMLADVLRAEGDDDAADAALLECLERWPAGDMADEAAWALLWPRLDGRRWAAAVAMADRLLELVPRERSYRAEGRTLYWRARARQHLGQLEPARGDWRRVLETYPLSWYAVLAHARLRLLDPEEAARTLAEVVAASQPPADPLEAIPESLWEEPHLRRGVALARMGLIDSARRELRAVRAGDEPEASHAIQWTRAALFGLAGAWDQATHITRAEEPRFSQHWPVGHHKRLWTLAHPRPWPDLVEAWAAQRGIDPHWVWSIMREESGFDPDIESWANAIGLMQIILPTAEYLARGTDLEVSAAALRDPAIAVELGSKYLAKLLAQHPIIPLASAGYNAGGGAVNKWRRQQGHLELDEFVERIPYREARGYAKRVTRALARYTWLYDDERMLDLPLAPPGPP